MKINKLLPLFFAFPFIFNSCVKEDDSPIVIPPFEGKVVTLLADDKINKGDPTEANQFWIELGTGKVTITHRENWDLGFYSGDDFRVILNSSLVMSVGKIENAINIDAVNSQTVASLKSLVQVANFQNNSQYIDNPNGQILAQTTGIDEIKLDENQNNVYLLNMGHKTYMGSTTVGSVYTMGEARGWKKIRILRHNGGYKIQYADLDDTNHKEFIVTKDSNYNHQFFSFKTENYVEIQPRKMNWDLSFTVFTNLTNAGSFMTSYVYPDFIISNTLGNVSAYEVVTAAGQGETEYTNFKLENVEPSKLVSNDQRIIGSNWRTTTGANGAEVYSNKFYIIKNSVGLYYKLRFLRIKDEAGNRGYPQFEYKPL